MNFRAWTAHARRGRRVAAQLEAGTVNVNDAYAPAWGSVDAPMGGMKASGLGRRHGEHGILKYTESQTIAVERVLPVGVPDGWDPARYATHRHPRPAGTQAAARREMTGRRTRSRHAGGRPRLGKPGRHECRDRLAHSFLDVDV
ncbi:aldehyde dehydrogenase family protein [Flexivirga caeni]|uniref:aldehyde dehydrogenase family protein n=1 Tax=Flexivirga caeni TaxID=2294115 RepID=UPI001FEA5F1A|nr:aldehyde dehydrogenase family protein [Flexivirga caeni]